MWRVGAVGKVSGCQPLQLALTGDRLRSIAVLMLAFQLCRDRQPRAGRRFGGKQARKCECGVGVKKVDGARSERLGISSLRGCKLC